METKKKKPFYRRWWFIALAVIIVGSIMLSPGSDSEKITWGDMILGDMLPKPPVSKGKIHTNAVDSLWLDIDSLSDKQFSDYVDACTQKGFTIDADSASSSYSAYNSKGYKLNLGHYGSDADMSIRLEAPMEMTAITWPIGTAGRQLPSPASTTGKFSYEQDDNFFVYVGDTTKADYAEYVNICSEKGFNVNYSKGDNYYYADNRDGWHIDIRYVGNNIMSINIGGTPRNEISSENASSPSSSVSEPATPEKAPEEKAHSNSNGLNPDFKAAMDAYEAFMNDYVAFMKKYKKNPADLSLLTDYADYMSRYADFVKEFDAWEGKNMNAAETAYYIDVQARVSKKLLEAAQ